MTIRAQMPMSDKEADHKTIHKDRRRPAIPYNINYFCKY